MLLKAGMSVRQAIFYNILSSILSFIGMASGILLGGISDVTPWIFSATAGIFLYVVNILCPLICPAMCCVVKALVDMMPELSSGHAHPLQREQQGGDLISLVLQLLGFRFCCIGNRLLCHCCCHVFSSHAIFPLVAGFLDVSVL